MEDEEKRRIASTNYITKIRTIEYPEKIELNDSFDTLLISTNMKNDIQAILPFFNQVVLIKDGRNTEINSIDFTNKIETNDYTIYSK